jgi:arylsulfatase A-like enzyme
VPSRATVLTGQYDHINGVPTNRETLDPNRFTFPKLLREARYQTAICGTWHLKSRPAGLDHYEVLWGQGDYYNPSLISETDSVRYEGYVTDIITDRAMSWLAGHDRDRPFLLMYQHKAPHADWDPGPSHLTLYDDVTIPEPATLFDDYSGRTSAATTQEMRVRYRLGDRQLKVVPPRGLTESQRAAWNTAYEPKNAAFRSANLAGKEYMRWEYQRLIKDYLRTVASVNDNLGRLLGSVNDGLVLNLDFAETFLEIAGVPIPAGMQGRSLVPLLRGEAPADWRAAVYYQFSTSRSPIGTGCRGTTA